MKTGVPMGKSVLIILVLLMQLVIMPACHKTPAEFYLESLEIVPQEANAGEIVTISAQVKNIGGTEGIYKVILKVDGPGTTEETEFVTVTPGKTKPVSFVIAKDKDKAYDVQLNDLRGTFRVLKPAEFLISNLVITPSVAKIGQAVIVTADIANVGEFEGSYPATLIINGSGVETKELVIPQGTTDKLLFVFTKDSAGTYNIEVGELSGILLVTEVDNVLVQLGAAYPELCQELLRLPDLKEIDDRDMEAIDDIASLALNPKYKSAFESMLDEGVKDKRKYCTPLEALLWIAYDKEFDRYNPLEYYSLTRLIDEGWENTTTSRNYTSDEWQNFDEVVDRLNSPQIVTKYVIDNFIYNYPGVSHYSRYSASKIFLTKLGDCGNQSNFITYVLIENGYVTENLCLQFKIDGSGHVVSLYEDKDNLFYYVDTTLSGHEGIFGPFKSKTEAIDNLVNILGIANYEIIYFPVM